MLSSVTKESPIFIDPFHTEQTKKTGNEVNIFHITAPDANLSRTESTEIIPPTKIYKRRWLMLSIFVSLSVSSGFQWIQFSIITSLLTKYVYKSIGSHDKFKSNLFDLDTTMESIPKQSTGRLWSIWSLTFH